MLREKCNKYIILLIIQILIVLALVPGCFRKEQLIYSRTGEEFNVLGAINEVGLRGDYMTLKPGVYQVRVYANVAEGQRMSVELCYENGPYRAIRTNAVTVFSGDEYIDFEAYVVNEVSTAYVQFTFKGMDASGIALIDIYKTSMGNRIALFTVILACFVLDSMLLFRKRILEGKVSKEQQVVFWALAAVVLLAYFPYLTDYYYYVGDTGVHLSRIAHLKDTLLQGGQFPVRIQSTWMYDHGYAVSLFYGDLFLYIPALLMIIGFSLMAAYKMFIFLVMVVAAYISYHCFKKCVGNIYSALFGSMFYMLASYRLLNIHIRGALGEFLAMTFLSLVCCGMYLLFTEDVASKDYKRHKWYLILGVSGILQCHNISLEMVVAFMALACVVGWKKTFRKQTLIQLLQAVGFVILLNAWYLIPFLYMMIVDSYKVNGIGQADILARALRLCEVFQLLPARVSLPFDEWGHMPASLGPGSGILLIGFLFRKRGENKNIKPAIVFASLSLLALLLCTDFIPWNVLRDLPGIGFVVSSIQFPWRFMSIATIAMAMFATFFCEYVRENEGRTLKIIVGIAGAVTIATAIYQVNLVAIEEAPIYLYEEENTGTIAISGAEYLLIDNEFYEYQYHAPVAEEGLEWSMYKKEGTNITIWVKNTSGGIRHIELPLIGYKGYGVDAEKAEVIPYITEERGSHGDLRIAVPAGYDGTIQVAYKGFLIFRISELVSVISILAVIAGNLYRKGKKLRNEQ